MLSPKTNLDNLRKLAHSDVLQRTKQLALEERQVGIELLHYLQEIDRRRLFTPQFSSLHEYVVRELGYSDGAAHRRISAMRLLRVVPELEPRLRDGSVNLSTASQVQNFIAAEKRITGKSIPQECARELVQQVSGKSARETEALLAARSPRVAALLQERPRSIDGQNVQITITLTPELQRKLRLLRDRMAHQNANPSLAEQLEMLADFALKRLEGQKDASARTKTETRVPAETKQQKVEPDSTPAAPSFGLSRHGSRSISSDTGATPGPPRHPDPKARPNGSTARSNARPRPSARGISQAVRRKIWNRAGARCEFRHPDGTRCVRTHLLQLDHRIPVAWGGGREPDNLQLLCATHNQWKSDRLPGE
jgi:hypothetical protein